MGQAIITFSACCGATYLHKMSSVHLPSAVASLNATPLTQTLCIDEYRPKLCDQMFTHAARYCHPISSVVLTLTESN